MLRASANWVDLAPRPDSWLSGFAARIEPATGQHDLITARAIVFEDDGPAIAVLACDLVAISPSDANDVRQRIAGRTPIPAANILITCTHTHSGPASLHFRGTLGHVDDAWLSSALDKIVELVVRVAGGLKPARLAYAATTVTGVGHNRQDDSHPIDETLRVVAVNDLAGAPIATLLNYATHPVVLGPGNQIMSADYPGEACRAVEAARGGTALFLQGACGDVNPLLYRERGWSSGTFEDTLAIGEKLGNAGMKALAEASDPTNGTIRVLTSSVEIPLAPPPAIAQIEADIARMELERRNQAAQGKPRQELGTLAMIDWARALLDAAKEGRVPTSVTAEIFVASIGDLRVVGVPFETYSDIALRIKEALHLHPVMFCSCANGVIGYVPTKRALEQGGYGPASSHRWYPGLLTPITYGADDLIVETAVGLGKEMEDSADPR